LKNSIEKLKFATIIADFLSMMKNKLNFEYDFEGSFCGLITTLKEYKLAWQINRALDIHLVKADDICLDFHKKEDLVISNFVFETEHSSLRLLKNRSVSERDRSPRFLVPELNKFDYFIILQGFEDTLPLDVFKPAIKNISAVQYLQFFEPNTLKSRENLMF